MQAHHVAAVVSIVVGSSAVGYWATGLPPRPNVNTFEGCYDAEPRTANNSSLASDLSDDAQAILSSGEELSKLPCGVIRATGPRSMYVGDSAEVDAELGVDVPDLLDDKPQSNVQQVTTGTLHVAHKMRAMLYGAGFDVKLKSPEEITVVDRLAGGWSWEVTAAKQVDGQFLTLEVFALPNKLPIKSYRQIIDVNLTFAQKMAPIQQDLNAAKSLIVTGLGIITTVLGVFGYRTLRRRSRRTQHLLLLDPEAE